jgi:WD40 repeat protein
MSVSTYNIDTKEGLISMYHEEVPALLCVVVIYHFLCLVLRRVVVGLGSACLALSLPLYVYLLLLTCHFYKGEPLDTEIKREGQCLCMAWHPRAAILASGWDDGTVCSWLVAPSLFSSFLSL